MNGQMTTGARDGILSRSGGILGCVTRSSLAFAFVPYQYQQSRFVISFGLLVV